MPTKAISSVDDMTQTMLRILQLRLPGGFKVRIQDGDLVIEHDNQVFIYLARTVTRG